MTMDEDTFYILCGIVLVLFYICWLLFRPKGGYRDDDDDREDM